MKITSRLASYFFGCLVPFIAPYRWRMVVAGFFSVCNQVLNIFPELLIGVAVDIATMESNSTVAKLGFTTIESQLLFLGFVTVLVNSTESLFEYLYTRSWGLIAQDLQHDVRVRVYNHLQRLPLSFFESRSIGSLTTVVNDDVSRLEQFFDGSNYESLSAFTQLVSSTLTVGVIFFIVSPQIMIIAFAPIPVVIALSFYFKNRLGELYKKVRHQSGIIAGMVSHNIRGIATIKSFVTQRYEQRRVTEASDIYRQQSIDAVKMTSLFVPTVRLCVCAGFVFTVVRGGFLATNGAIALGSYSVLIFLSSRLIWPFIGLGDIIDAYERVMAAAERINSILETPIDEMYAQIPRSSEFPEPLEIGDIEFSHVSFGYDPARPILRDVSLTIKENQTVAFVGTTGCGKSTLMKLLLRLYRPQKGEIVIGGADLSSLDAYALRRSIGLVSQEIFMIAGTIRENICYGAVGVTEEDLVYAAKAAEIHDFIMQLPQGYDTHIEEQGQMLSGGQRQRIAIARALVRNPYVLILDEATSAVDNETEEAINTSLAKMKHDLTIVIIAHRLSAVRNADMIFVLDKGEIVESGVHADLVAKGGIYQRLWRIQSGNVLGSGA